MPYSKEAADIPSIAVIRPTYSDAGVVNAVVCVFNWIRRVKNDSDASDQLPPLETTSKAVDLFVTNKSVNVPGLGVITYRQISQAIKLVADAER